MLNLSLASLIGIAMVFLLVWVIISIPIYFAARIVAGRKTTFGKALIASLVAPLVTLFFFFVVAVVLAPFLGPLAIMLAMLVALFMLIYLYSSIFDTGLLGGFAIAVFSVILSFIVWGILSVMIFAFLGLTTSAMPPGFHGLSGI